MKKMFSYLLILLPTIVMAGNQFIGSDIVGWSYNIFDRYANNESKKKPLFDFGKEHRMVMLENISKHDIRTVTGSNSHQYTKSVATRLGMSYSSAFGLFKGSMQSNFGKKSMGNIDTSFVTLQDYIWKYRISLDIRSEKRDITRLKKFMDPVAREDINTMDPEKLFNIYGTHFITKAYIGGRADYHATVENSSKFSQQDISVNVKLAFKRFKSNLNVTHSKTNREISKNRKTKLTIIGGNSEYINNIHNNEQYKSWVSGIKKHPVLCDFERGSLSPIWKLADTYSRKKQLEQYFKKTYILKFPLAKLVRYTNERPKWKPRNGTCFFIKSKSSNRYFDLAGMGYFTPDNNGEKVILWDNDRLSDRVFCVEKSREPQHYLLSPVSNRKALTISGSFNKSSLTNKYQRKIPAVLWRKSDVNSEQFAFELVDKSSAGYVAVYIKSKISGLYLQAEHHRNGAKIIQMPFTGKSNQIWHFEKASKRNLFKKELTTHTFLLRNVKNHRVMDLPGYGRVSKKFKAFKRNRSSNCKNGTNVGLYKIDGGSDQHVRFVPAGRDSYYIEFQHCGSRPRLDITGKKKRRRGNSMYNEGQNAQIWGHTNNIAQKFKIRAVGNGRFLIINEASRRAVTSSHNNTFQGKKASSRDRAQQWELIDIHTKKRLQKF